MSPLEVLEAAFPWHTRYSDHHATMSLIIARRNYVARLEAGDDSTDRSITP